MAGFGFVPYRKADGSPYTGHTEQNTLTAASQAIFHGDALAMDASGTIIVAPAGEQGIIGIAVGFEWTASGIKYATNSITAAQNAANTVTVTYVPVENMIFRVRGDSGATLVAVDIGANVDHVATAGSATTGISGHLLGTVVASGATAQWRLVGLATEPIGNAVGSADTTWLVRANETWLNNDATIMKGF